MMPKPSADSGRLRTIDRNRALVAQDHRQCEVTRNGPTRGCSNEEGIVHGGWTEWLEPLRWSSRMLAWRANTTGGVLIVARVSRVMRHCSEPRAGQGRGPPVASRSVSSWTATLKLTILLALESAQSRWIDLLRAPGLCPFCGRSRRRGGLVD
jgi:hypothetical protein